MAQSDVTIATLPPRPLFPLTSLLWDDVGRNRIVATNNLFSFYQGGQHVAENIIPMIPFSVVLSNSFFLINLKFYTIIIWGFSPISKRTKPVLLRSYLSDLNAP